MSPGCGSPREQRTRCTAAACCDQGLASCGGHGSPRRARAAAGALGELAVAVESCVGAARRGGPAFSRLEPSVKVRPERPWRAGRPNRPAHGPWCTAAQRSALQPSLGATATDAPRPARPRAPQAHVEDLLRRATAKAWCRAHGREPAPPRLHPAIQRTIREW